LAEGIFASGFLTNTPLLAAVWTYLSLSFALGSVPSREDLSGLPLVLLVFGGGILLIVLLRMGSERVLSSAVYELSTLAAGLYAMPATVAVVAALTMGLAERTIRHWSRLGVEMIAVNVEALVWTKAFDERGK
jgi:hypothetical protein